MYQKQIQKHRASESKDMHIGSGNELRNKSVRYDGRTKNNRYGYNKPSRSNSNRNYSYRGNQRFNRYSKLNEQRFNRFKNRGGYSPERFDVEEHYTERDYLPQYKADSEDYFAEAVHYTSPITDLSPRPISYILSNKRNERTNYYDSNRKYDGEKKGNFYHRSIQIPEGEGVYHTSAVTPFLNGTEAQSPVVPLKKKGRPHKQPLIPRGNAGENAIMSASTPPHHSSLQRCRRII
ncbi:ubiquitin domain-containing protein UBFD1 [Trichonephila clavipes]|nr:ubiquitin domain-containing protein UBFD1 [Trichonephila clavipes]